jgi:hypothetical protein
MSVCLSVSLSVYLPKILWQGYVRVTFEWSSDSGHSTGLNFAKLPRLSRRMTKFIPVEKQGKLTSLLSYSDLDVQLPGWKKSRKLSTQPW